MKTIKIEIPKNFMNVAVTKKNNLIADNNNSSEYDFIRVPLPKGKWVIKNIKKTTVSLIDDRGLLFRLFNL